MKLSLTPPHAAQAHRPRELRVWTDFPAKPGGEERHLLPVCEGERRQKEIKWQGQSHTRDLWQSHTSNIDFLSPLSALLQSAIHMLSFLCSPARQPGALAGDGRESSRCHCLCLTCCADKEGSPASRAVRRYLPKLYTHTVLAPRSRVINEVCNVEKYMSLT